jgi:hypothetical protein
MLLDAGNPLSAVSRWIGHASTEITRHYWEREPGSNRASRAHGLSAALARSLHLPWAPEGPRPLTTADTMHSSDDEDVLDPFTLLLDWNRALRRRLLRD